MIARLLPPTASLAAAMEALKEVTRSKLEISPSPGGTILRQSRLREVAPFAIALVNAAITAQWLMGVSEGFIGWMRSSYGGCQ